jgi:membrane fusion protein (multidrug efflux system)
MNALLDKPAPDQAATVSTPGNAPPRPSLVRRLRPLIALVVLAVAAVSALWWFAEGRWIMSTDNAYVQGDIAVLSARVEGNVAAIPVADNQAVRAGDPLVVLDPSDWQAKLDQAEGAAAEARAAIETATRQVDQSRALIAQSVAGIDQAEAETVRASADATRSGTLVGAGWTSRQANELATATARKAEAGLAQSRAVKQSSEQALIVAQAQAVQAQAKLASADAAVRLAQNNLAYATIRAPFDGIAGNRAAQLGQHVAVGQQLIAVAPAAERLFVIANFKETQLRQIRPGLPVLLTPDIDSGAAVHGRVDSLAPATGALFSLLPPENATGNFTKVVQRVPVKIVIDAADAHAAQWLRAGLSVTADVDTRGPDAQRRGLFGAAAAAIGLR